MEKDTHCDSSLGLETEEKQASLNLKASLVQLDRYALDDFPWSQILSQSQLFKTRFTFRCSLTNDQRVSNRGKGIERFESPGEISLLRRKGHLRCNFMRAKKSWRLPPLLRFSTIWLWLRSTWRYKRFEAFFDWSIRKNLCFDWSIKHFEAFVASSGPQPISTFMYRPYI